MMEKKGEEQNRIVVGPPAWGFALETHHLSFSLKKNLLQSKHRCSLCGQEEEEEEEEETMMTAPQVQRRPHSSRRKAAAAATAAPSLPAAARAEPHGGPALSLSPPTTTRGSEGPRGPRRPDNSNSSTTITIIIIITPRTPGGSPCSRSPR